MKGEKILEPFEVLGKKVVAVDYNPCSGCFFAAFDGCRKPEDVESCSLLNRHDKNSVKYVEIKYALPDQ